MLMGSITWTCLMLAGAPVAEVWHMNQRGFQIPIRVQEARKKDIRELRLYVSADNGQSWQLHTKATPDKHFFSFMAPRDGTYWFKVQVVDRVGNIEPRNLTEGPVGQRIVVDSSKPTLRFTHAERENDQVMVGWIIQEEYPDMASFKLEYRSADAPEMPWTPAAVMPAPEGEEKFQVTVPGAVALRLSVKDKAGNLGQAQTTAASRGGSVPAGHHDPANAITRADVPGPLGPSTPPPPSPLPPPPTAPPEQPLMRAEPEKTRSADWEGNPSGGVAPASLANTSSGRLPPVRIVNKRQVKLDFDVTKIGPSGLGNVDVYVTGDGGKSWQRIPGDPQALLPAISENPGVPVHGSVTVSLPQEGKAFGYFVVVKSRAGLGLPPPQAGEAPHVRLEMDTTLPQAEMYRPQADGGRRDALILTWEASDRNLAPKPISLEWAEHKDGPWEVIGEREMANTGRYTWQVPDKMPPRVYLKLIVRDTAGNVAVAQTDQPILIDLSVPQVQNVGISLP